MATQKLDLQHKACNNYSFGTWHYCYRHDRHLRAILSVSSRIFVKWWGKHAENINLRGGVIFIGASPRKPHTSDVNPDFFVYIHIHVYRYICRMSFCIYLSFISTICKFEQFMHMHFTLCYRERPRAIETHEQRVAKLQ